ncbi:tetratricopeptide repeat protein 13 [Ciona intestinalis]
MLQYITCTGLLQIILLRLVHGGIAAAAACKSGIPNQNVKSIDAIDPSAICFPDECIPGKKCETDQFDAQKIERLAEDFLTQHFLPLLCKDPADNQKLGIGLVYIKSSYPEVAVGFFNDLLLNSPADTNTCAAFYFMRGIAFTQLGLDGEENSLNSISDFTQALELAERKDQLKIYETRAETYSKLNDHYHAYKDYSEAINILPSFRLYLERAICLVFMEKYIEAYEDLKISTRMQPQQPLALHYMATCLFHMRRYPEALESFKAVLALKENDVDILNAIALTYREMGDFDSAFDFIEQSISVNPMASDTYQRKGELLYKRGRVEEALQAFKYCVSLSPTNDICQYMKGVCHATLGQFYSAIKEITKGTTERVVLTADGNYLYPPTIFLREFCRYLHSHLDNNRHEVNPDKDLNASFRENWSKSTRNFLKNYTEQPGLQPHVKDVSAKDFQELPAVTKRLLCQAHQLGRHLYDQGVYEDDGIIGNLRLFTASGLAAIEISQIIQEYWKSPKSYRNKNGEKFTWRDAFDIAIQWIRLYRMEQPVFWVDTPTDFSSPHIHRIALLQNNETLFRYDDYLPTMLKKLSEEIPTSEEIPFNYSYPVSQFYKVFLQAQDKWSGDNRGAYVVTNNDHISMKDRDQKTLDAYSLLLKLDNEEKLMLMMDQQLTWAKSQQYHAELDFLWQKIIDEKRKLPNTSPTTLAPDSLIDLVLSLGYYFINLMPVSRSTAMVAQCTTAGLLLGLGRETVGRAPIKKEVLMEALTSRGPETFCSTIRSWHSIKKATSALTHLESVSDRFQTYRQMIEALHYDLSTSCTSYRSP